MPKPQYFAQALYTIDIGQIDITQEFLNNKTDDQVKAVVPRLVASLSSNIKVNHTYIVYVLK